MKTLNVLALCAATLSLAACKKDVPAPAEPEPAPAPVATAEPEPEAAPAPEDPSDVHIEGDHLTIDRKIHFATDSDEILDDSTEILDHIAQALENHTEFGTVHVIGHTDTTGDDAHNMELSQRRAEAVVLALRNRGVAQNIDARGAGETEPACTSDDTAECHEKNRRVEFIVEK
ncbi:MAG: OmpA family protein [Myxococcota bacterium]